MHSKKRRINKSTRRSGKGKPTNVLVEKKEDEIGRINKSKNDNHEIKYDKKEKKIK